MFRQRTIKTTIRATGVGLHTGKKVYMTLRPGGANTGIIFRRIDIDKDIDIPAKAELVGETMLGTTLIKDGIKVPEGFIYSSDRNAHWMTGEELLSWLRENSLEIGKI